jgi:hypothetical protein
MILNTKLSASLNVQERKKLSMWVASHLRFNGSNTAAYAVYLRTENCDRWKCLFPSPPVNNDTF